MGILQVSIILMGFKTQGKRQMFWCREDQVPIFLESIVKVPQYHFKLNVQASN